MTDNHLPPSDNTALLQHEVLHVAHIVAAMFEEYIADHSYTKSRADLSDKAEEIAHLLHDFYQLVGNDETP